MFIKECIFSVQQNLYDRTLKIIKKAYKTFDFYEKY